MIGYVIFIAVLCLSGTSFAEIPTINCPISLNKEEYNKCAAEQLMKLKPFLKEGIPELDVPPMDTFVGHSFKVEQDFKLHVQSYEVDGLASFEVKKINVNPQKNTAKLVFHVPHATVRADYEAKVFPLDIYESGHATIDLDDIDIVVNAKARKVADESGIDRFEIETLHCRVFVDRGHIVVKTDEHDTLSTKTIESLFNEHPKVILAIARPFINEKATEVIRGIVDGALKKFPVD